MENEEIQATPEQEPTETTGTESTVTVVGEATGTPTESEATV